MEENSRIAPLVAVNPREAWSHEAHDFTPWLSENLDLLGAEISIPLEKEATEVSVTTFSADILARNKFDGSFVLIENQLEGSDHTHLGQILTYLAGLDAKTVIWVATSFRDAHLSAVNWLNENTSEEFSFFAVKLKVVRIADSPLAPIFEIVARPNGWERRLHAIRDTGPVASERTGKRFEFWNAFVESNPGEAERNGPAGMSSNRWHLIEELDIAISMYLANSGVGLFIRAGRNGDKVELKERLAEKSSEIQARLGCEMGDGDQYFFGQDLKGDYSDTSQRPAMIEWLRDKSSLYESVLKEVFTGN